jgi:hypothetical protein
VPSNADAKQKPRKYARGLADAGGVGGVGGLGTAAAVIYTMPRDQEAFQMTNYRGVRSVPAIPRRSLRTPRSPRSPPDIPTSLVKKAKSRRRDVDYVAAILCLGVLRKNHTAEPSELAPPDVAERLAGHGTPSVC